MRVRNNVKFLSTAEKTRFANAVLALKTQPSVLHPGDANLNRYDDYAEVHMNAMMANPGWAHKRPAFFPWHRVMLLAFENDLVAIDPSVTIPYWDWPDSASNPFTNDFLGGNGPEIQKECFNRWDMIFGNSGQPDAFDVTMASGSRSRIRDLGLFDWDEKYKVERLPVYEERVREPDMKAIDGHIYLVHFRDRDTDDNFYTLFRVEKLEPGKSVDISWKIIPAPKQR